MFLVGYELPELTEAIFENDIFDIYFELLNIVPRPDIISVGEKRFLACTAAGHWEATGGTALL